MLCDLCKIREAKYRVIEVVDGNRKVMNLCEVCTPKVLYAIPEKGIEESGLIIPEEARRKQEIASFKELRCPSCGMSYDEFLKVMKFGCAECYKAFREKLRVLLKDIHGSSEYKGRFYTRDPKKLALIREKRRLEGLIESYIIEEKFEEAAKLRDKIKEIEEKLGWQ